MAAEVILTVTEGPLNGREYVFRDPVHCLVGRGPDCFVYVPDTRRMISRHHCVFEIRPPQVQVADLGSLNGTFVNGEKIGRRTPEGSSGGAAPARPLADGDEVRVGDTVFAVSVFDEDPAGYGEPYSLSTSGSLPTALPC